MAKFLLGGDPNVTLGTESVPLFGVQQKAAADTAVTLARVIGRLAMGALRHVGSPVQ
jgi:hypothetical protein